MKMLKTIILGVLVTGNSLVGFVADVLPTPPDVWKSFDPDAGDFNEEIVSEKTMGGIYYRDSYISAYVNGEEIRVYCKYVVKAGAQNAPGLMDVHGWMGAPRPDMSYVNDGWAVMSHDYCGKAHNRTHYTKYPQSLQHGNMDRKQGPPIWSHKKGTKDSITDYRQTSDYMWYVIQRRVLSYLLVQKELDKKRIGAKGYSYGGTIMWNLGMDPRVKAIVAYFGIGWLEYYRTKRVWMYNKPHNEPAKSPGEKLYLSAIAPQAHVPYITAATLWLNGTNDHHGGHERALETFKMFKPGVPYSFALQARGHHNTEKVGQNCKLWLEKHVLAKDLSWPSQPASEIKLNDQGVPQLHISPASPDKVTELKAFYALKNPVSYGRSWRDMKALRQGNTWVAPMPVINVDDYVFGFANVKYDSTIVVSSAFNAAIPSKLGKAVATDKVSDELSREIWSDVAPVEGVGGVTGFRPIDNHKGTSNKMFSDPKYKAPQGAALSFKFYCTQPQTLILTVDHRYVKEIEITASNEWQSMLIPAAELVNKHHKNSLRSWSEITSINIRPQAEMDITKVIFAQFKWKK